MVGSSARSNGEARPKARIVVVEDEDDSRSMLKLLLESRGYRVTEARDGVEAIEVIRKVHPDVAFVDIGLPFHDGYEVARRIRNEASLDDVTLVALTGFGADAQIERGREAGFNEHLTKPVDLRRIEAIVARSLEV